LTTIGCVPNNNPAQHVVPPSRIQVPGHTTRISRRISALPSALEGRLARVGPRATRPRHTMAIMPDTCRACCRRWEITPQQRWRTVVLSLCVCTIDCGGRVSGKSQRCDGTLFNAPHVYAKLIYCGRIFALVPQIRPLRSHLRHSMQNPACWFPSKPHPPTSVNQA
jgi:hypothetical protein